MEQHAAEALADKLAGGHWTHDYALTASEAAELGLPVKVGMPLEVITLMKLYPQPVQQSGVEFYPSTSRAGAGCSDRSLRDIPTDEVRFLQVHARGRSLQFKECGCPMAKKLSKSAKLDLIVTELAKSEDRAQKAFQTAH